MEKKSIALYQQFEQSVSLNAVAEIMSTLSESIKDYILTGKSSNEIITLKSDYYKFSEIALSLSLETNDLHRKAYLLGYIKSILDLTNDDKDVTCDNSTSIEVLNSYTHLQELLELLYHENSLSHQDLAKALKINGSNLSNFINRVEEFDLFETRKIGKNKYYYISPTGRSLYRKLSTLSAQNFTVESYTDFLFILLDNIQNEIAAPFVDISRLLDKITSSYKNLPISRPKLFKQKLVSICNTISKQQLKSKNGDICYIQISSNDRESVRYEINP